MKVHNYCHLYFEYYVIPVFYVHVKATATPSNGITFGWALITVAVIWALSLLAVVTIVIILLKTLITYARSNK